MTANKAEVGKKYLTKKGFPVVVTGVKGDKIVVKAESTGNTIVVEKDYELLPYEESRVSKDAKLLLAATGKSKNGKGPRKTREGSLAAVIDQFLFDGKHTVKEIAAELPKKAGAACKGKDLEANVRARLFTYRRKGLRVEKDDQKRIRVIKKGS